MELSQITARLSKCLKTGNVLEFARESGVSRATLYRIMGGWKNPTLKTLERIEAQLDLADRRKRVPAMSAKAAAKMPKAKVDTVVADAGEA